MRSLRERIGGRWAVSLRGYLIIAAVSIPAFFFTEPSIAFSRLPQLTIVAVLGSAAIGPVLWLANLTVLRGRRTVPAPVWAVVAVGVMSGVARSTTIYLAISQFGLPEESPYWARALTGAILGGIYVPLVAYLLDAWEQFSQERLRLLNTLAAEESRAAEDQMYLRTLRSALITDIQARVDTALTQARDALTHNTNGDGSAVTALRRAADLDVRRTSHDLWDEELSKSRLHFRDVLSFMVSTQPYYPLWALVPISMAAFLPLLRTVEPYAAIAVIAATCGYALTVMLLANYACRKWRSRSMGIFWFSEVALLLTGPLAAWLLNSFGAQGVTSPYQWGILTALTVTVLGTLTGAAPAVARRAEQALDALRQAVDRAEVVALASQIEAQKVRRDVARYLHGTVRANLTAIALKLEAALRDGDVETVSSLTSKAKKYLSVDMSSQLTKPEVSVAAALTELQALWAGLVSISYVMGSGFVSLPRYTSRAVVDLVTEAINDAARHARATHVSVRLAISGQTVRIQVDNDGMEPTQGAPGLGSRTLDTLSPGAWSLTRTEEGVTRLTAAVTVLR